MFYRLRRGLSYVRFRHRTGRIHSTPPMTCRGDAPCEIHTMLSDRDVPLYLVAIKSFLRFCQDVAVVVHSDGTPGQDMRNLHRNITDKTLPRRLAKGPDDRSTPDESGDRDPDEPLKRKIHKITTKSTLIWEIPV